MKAMGCAALKLCILSAASPRRFRRRAFIAASRKRRQ